MKLLVFLVFFCFVFVFIFLGPERLLKLQSSSLSCLLLGDLLSTLGCNLDLDGGGGGSLLGLLGDEDRVNVGENTSLGDGHFAEKLVELLVVSDCQLDVAGDDAGLLVVASSVACKFEDLSSEVLEDGRKVHGGTSANTSGELSLLQEAANAAHRELKTSLDGLGGGLLSILGTSASFSSDCFSFA